MWSGSQNNFFNSSTYRNIWDCLSYWLAIEMAGRSVKFFSTIQKFYGVVGIHPPQLNQNRCSFNRKDVIFCNCLMPSVLSTTAFILFRAKSVLDFGISAFFLACWFVGIPLCVSLVWQMGNILKFIGNSEAFVETSMWLNTKKAFSWNSLLKYVYWSIYALDRITCKDRIQRM